MSTHEDDAVRKAFDEVWTFPRLDASAGTPEAQAEEANPDDADEADGAPYDGLSDADLTPEQLDDRYNPDGNGEHPTHTRAAWCQDVIDQHTSLGYWHWLSHVVKGEASEAHRADDSPGIAGQ